MGGKSVGVRVCDVSREKKNEKRAGNSVGVSVWDANREIERSGKGGGG